MKFSKLFAEKSVIMKFSKLIALLLSISLLGSCSSQKELLPLGTFPLEKSTVEAALLELDIPWTVVEEDNQENDKGESSRIFTLHNENGKIIAYVASTHLEESDYLNLYAVPPSFGPGLNLMDNMTDEYFEQAFALATILHGGFETKDQVFEAFSQEYQDESKIIVTDKRLNIEGIRWGKEISDLYCFVAIEEIASNEEEKYLSSIDIFNKLPEGEIYDTHRELLKK